MEGITTYKDAALLEGYICQLYEQGRFVGDEVVKISGDSWYLSIDKYMDIETISMGMNIDTRFRALIEFSCSHFDLHGDFRYNYSDNDLDDDNAPTFRLVVTNVVKRSTMIKAAR
jgi:hypothetical protein